MQTQLISFESSGLETNINFLSIYHLEWYILSGFWHGLPQPKKFMISIF